MTLVFHPNFKKHYKKRIFPNSKLVEQTRSRIDLFRQNPLHPLLRNHPLIRSKNAYRSFSINGDIRVIYEEIDNETVVFYDIGSHNQIY